MVLAATPAIAFADNEDGSDIKAIVTKSADVGTVAPGGEVGFTIEVIVTGENEDDLLYGISVKDKLLAGLEYVQGSLASKDTKGDLKSDASFTDGVLTAKLYTESLGGEDIEYYVYPGQSITFT